MLRVLAFLLALCVPASAQWGGQGAGAGVVVLANPQVSAQFGAPHVYDNFHQWVCSEWGHAVPCTNHIANTRAQTAWCPTRGGLLIQVPSGGTPCHTDLGLWNNNIVFTNNIEFSRDLSQAIWVKSGATTGADIGMDGASCANCQVTFTGAVGVCTASCTVLQTCTLGACTSSARQFTIRVRRVTGVGAVSLTLDGGATSTAMTSANCFKNDGTASGLIVDQYVTCLKVQTNASPVYGIIGATVGDVVDVDFASDYFTSAVAVLMPIVTTSGSLSPAADNTATAGQLNADLNNATASLVIQSNSNASAVQTPVSFGTTANRPSSTGASTTTAITANNVATTNTNGGSEVWSSALGVVAAFAWDANGDAVSAGGAAATTSANVMANSSTSYIGSTNGGNASQGPFGSLITYPGIKLPTAALAGISGLPQNLFW